MTREVDRTFATPLFVADPCGAMLYEVERAARVDALWLAAAEERAERRGEQNRNSWRSGSPM